MFFKKFFFNGESFPKRYAVYFCNLCQKEEFLEAPVGKNFDLEPRMCHTCKAVDANDQKQNLLKKREVLVNQIGKLQEELDRLNVELLTSEEFKKESTTLIAGLK